MASFFSIVVVSCYLIGFQAIFSYIWVMCAGQGKARSWHSVFRDVDIYLIRRESGGVVIDVLNIYFDHADFFVIGKHLHGELALGAFLAQCFPVNSLLGVEQTTLGVHHPKVGFLTLSSLTGLLKSESGIFGYVPNHCPWTLFLRDRVIQVFQSQGLSP
uniref:Uncharacterized protein n=1 Tax=Cynoglossus semilaevis TaxID=244447 RepID=A0A3P8UCC9_CYNSE